MLKRLFYSFGLVLSLFMLVGCDVNKSSMDDIEIYTTNYPTYFIVERLYGEHSTIHSIYPNGVDINSYKLTDKQLRDYSDSDLYIFNGLSNEKDYAVKMREINDDLKILDTTLSMEYNNGLEELWLDPSNLLMMAQNVKTGFKEYTDNYYLNNDINENYENLKVDVSNLDAKFKQVVSNSDVDCIVASSDMFKYLEKYGLIVYSLDSGVSNKTIEDVKSLIEDGDINYIFVKEGEKVNSTVQGLIDETGIETLEWYTLSNLSESNKNANEDYFSLMNKNIDMLKSELYN